MVPGLASYGLFGLLLFFSPEQVISATRERIRPGDQHESPKESEAVGSSADVETIITDKPTFTFEGRQWSFILPDCDILDCGNSSSHFAEQVSGDRDTGFKNLQKRAGEEQGQEQEQKVEEQQQEPTNFQKELPPPSIRPYPVTPWANIEYPPKVLARNRLVIERERFRGHKENPWKEDHSLNYYQAAPYSKTVEMSPRLFQVISASNSETPLDAGVQWTITQTNFPPIDLHYIISPYLLYMVEYVNEFKEGEPDFNDATTRKRYETFTQTWTDIVRLGGDILRDAINNVKENVYEGDARLKFSGNAFFSRHAEYLLFAEAEMRQAFIAAFDWSNLTRDEAKTLHALLKRMESNYNHKGRWLSSKWAEAASKLQMDTQSVGEEMTWDWSWHKANAMSNHVFEFSFATENAAGALGEAIRNPETKFRTPGQGDYQRMNDDTSRFLYYRMP
ncbi:MAG: hypothetical protein M1831_002972 [Alyxoria varia]|nr:MAG: hypothetical protein M1831_002972 [Alyxoria varia]